MALWKKTWVGIAGLVLLAGCYDISLPSSLPVTVPENGEVNAKAKTGPVSLAGTSWMAYRQGTYLANGESHQPLSDDPLLVGRVQFGPDGQVVECDLGEIIVNGISAKALLGDTIFPDAQLHPAVLPATFYIAQSYGLNVDDHFAADIFGKYFVGPALAGSVSMMISGTISQDGSRFEGIMRVTLESTPDVPGTTPDQAGTSIYEIPVFADRDP